MSSAQEVGDTVAQSPLPSLRALYFELGCALVAHGRDREAVVVLDQALREAGDEPRVVDIKRTLAAARAAIGDADEALDAGLQALLDAGPGDAQEVLQQVETLIVHARCLANSPLLNDSRRWPALVANSALPVQTRVDAGVLLGRTLLQMDRLKAAEPILAAAAQLATPDPAPLQLYGRALERLGRREDAIAAFEAAHRRAIDSRQDGAATGIAIEWARVLLATGQVELALTSLPDPLPTDDRLRAQTLEVRGAALLASGAADQALAVSSEAMKLVPGVLDVLRIQAQALVALHRNEEALRIIDKGLDSDPADEDLQLRRLLAQVEGQTDLDSTDEWQRYFLRIDREVVDACLAEPAWRGRDDDGRAHYARAMLFEVLGDFPQAKAECLRALDLGFGEGLPSEPKAPVHALLAESLKQLGEVQAATTAHFEAGIAYFIRGEWSGAVQHLEAVVTTQPEHPRASWFLVDALSAQAASLIPTSARNVVRDDEQAILAKRKRLLTRAQQVWDQAARTLPDQIEAWAYGSRAVISESCVQFQPQRRADLLWGGVTFIERGLLKDHQDAFLWTLLGRAYRLLGLFACARAATDMALRITPHDLDVLQERSILCGNTGDYDGEQTALEQFNAQLEESTLDEAERRLYGAWYLAARAYLSESFGAHEEALRFVKRSLQMDSGEPWIRMIAGRAYRMLGNREASQRVFTEILHQPDTGELDWKIVVADAQFALGQPDEALRGYETWRLETGRSPDDIEINVGLCQLLRGDVKGGRRTIEAYISRDLGPDDLDPDDLRWLRYRLRVVEEEGESELREALKEVGAHLMALAERKVQELTEHPNNPDSELLSVMDKAGDDARAAAIAGLARRAGERDDWEAATGWYERLEAIRYLFPEVNTAFENVASTLERRAHDRLGTDSASAAVQTLESAIVASRHAGRPLHALASMHQALGDALVRSSEAEPARVQYASALDMVGSEEIALVAGLQGRVAIASDLDGLSDQRRELLTKALRGYAALGDAEPGRALGELAQSLISSVRDYSRLDAAWASAGEDRSLPADLRPAVLNARVALVGALDNALGMGHISEDLIPVVLPIVLELGDGLVPIVDPRQDGGHFLDELMPAMRERIFTGTGVTVPGVRARSNSALKSNEFTIQVDEIPVGTAALDPVGRFAVNRGLQEGAWLTDFHPLTGDSSLWAIHTIVGPSNDQGDQLTAADVLVHHIECVVRANLRRFLGPQEVSALVSGWAEQDKPLVAAVLPDEDAQLRLTWVLQALADDAIPLTDWTTLLSGIRDAGGINTPTRVLYRALRLRVRDHYTGAEHRPRADSVASRLRGCPARR